MEINENSIEKSLYNDAGKIVIDEEFKLDLKNKIMFAGKYNNITNQPKHKNNFMRNRYLKIASGFVICVFVGGSIFKAVDIQSKNIFTKIKGTTNSTIPVISSKGSIKNSSDQASGLKVLDDIIKNNYKNKQLMSIKTNTNSASDIQSVKNVKNVKNVKDSLLAENVAFNSGSAGAANKDDGYTEIKQGSDSEVKPVVPEVVVPEAVTKPPTDVASVPQVKLIAYDSRYSDDATKLASVKDDGIYVQDLQTSKETKLIAYNDKTQVVNKPNFTPSGGIIYYKADKTDVDNGAIYLSSENGKVSTKLADGKNPMVSKDGKSFVYESEGKIYMQSLDLHDNSSWYIATGKYPAFSNDGNLISYVKEGIQIQSPDTSTSKITSFAKMASFVAVPTTEKTISTLCVYNIKNKCNSSITDNGSNADSSIESWSGAIRDDDVTSAADVTSQYSYYESIWSLDNKEVHAIKVDNETGLSEVTNFKLDK